MKKVILGLAAVLALSANAASAQKVVTLPNGVKVTIIQDGNGATPVASSKVQVLYKGTFKDGRVFDQSLTPIGFPLNGVIPCWTTGLQQVKAGGTVRLECPAETAYGSRGAGDTIPPNTPLNFVVKLLSVQ